MTSSRLIFVAGLRLFTTGWFSIFAALEARWYWSKTAIDDISHSRSQLKSFFMLVVCRNYGRQLATRRCTSLLRESRLNQVWAFYMYGKSHSQQHSKCPVLSYVQTILDGHFCFFTPPAENKISSINTGIASAAGVCNIGMYLEWDLQTCINLSIDSSSSSNVHCSYPTYQQSAAVYTVDSAPSLGLGVYYFLSLTLSVRHDPLYKTLFLNFWFRPLTPKIASPKLAKNAYNSSCMTDRPEMFAPTRGWPIQWNHAKCCGADPCCHGNDIWARRGV